MTKYEQFIKDVTDNPDKYTKYVKLAVDRHLNDLKKDWNYEWSKDAADRVIDIISRLRFTKGRWYGKQFELAGYQSFILAVKYGWLRKGTSLRRFKFGYQTEPRGGGKSEFSAAQMIYMTWFDGEASPVGLIAATKWEQARYIYDPCSAMVKQLANESEAFGSVSRVMQYEIKELRTNGYITKISADATKEDGANPHYAVVDEYHAHPDDAVLKVIETGAMKRDNALVDVVTTAGFNKNGPDYHMRQVAKKVLEGNIENDNFFAWVNEPDEDDDPEDSKTWYKLNLNLGKTPDFYSFEANYKNAKAQGGTAWVEFLTKNLNMYTDAASVWIEDAIWQKCIKPIKEKDLIGLKCYVGIDLSSRRDLTAVCYYFPELKFFKVEFYCPDEKIKSERRADGVDYYEFAKFGTITITPGNTIDYDFIVKDIIENSYNYKYELLGYDPYNADLIVPKFESQGIRCGAVRQGFLTLSPATKRIEKELVDGNLFHEGCPVMRWNMGNVELERDSAGNVKVSKKNEKNKVDGVAALVTAMAAYMHEEINNVEQRITLEDMKKMYG